MVTIDTNVLVRLLVNDDDEQHKLVVQFFRNQEQILIPLSIFLESEWVLRGAFKKSRAEIIRGFELVAGLPNVEVKDVDSFLKSLSMYKKGMDYGDALHFAQNKSENLFYTFDVRFVKKASKHGISNIRLLDS